MSFPEAVRYYSEEVWLTGTCPVPVAPAPVAKRVRLLSSLKVLFLFLPVSCFSELAGVVPGLGVPILHLRSFLLICFGEPSFLAPF